MWSTDGVALNGADLFLVESPCDEFIRLRMTSYLLDGMTSRRNPGMLETATVLDMNTVTLRSSPKMRVQARPSQSVELDAWGRR